MNYKERQSQLKLRLIEGAKDSKSNDLTDAIKMFQRLGIEVSLNRDFDSSLETKLRRVK